MVEALQLCVRPSRKAEERQVNTLVYTMGNEADDILISFKLSEEDRKKYEVVKEKYSYFIKSIYKRARFNCRRQEEAEDAFIMDLHRLAEHCGFGELSPFLPTWVHEFLLSVNRERDDSLHRCHHVVLGLRTGTTDFTKEPNPWRTILQHEDKTNPHMRITQ